MHGPRFGMPWRSSSAGFGSWPGPSARPMTAIRFWSLGHLHWYVYESPVAPPPEWASAPRYFEQAGSMVGFDRAVGSSVEAGHDDHAVVVVRGGDRRLDLVVAAQPEEPAVGRRQALGGGRSEPAVIGRADVVAVFAGALDRTGQQRQRVGLADDARRPRKLAVERRCE